MKFLIGIIIYLASALGSWKFLQKAYSEKGRWSRLTPGTEDFLITILPAFNTVLVIVLLIDTITNQLSFDFSKFFKIKNKINEK